MFVTNTHWPDPPRANLSNTFVFAFEALRLPLRFVLALSLCETEGLYKIKAHLAQKKPVLHQQKLIYTPKIVIFPMVHIKHLCILMLGGSHYSHYRNRMCVSCVNLKIYINFQCTPYFGKCLNTALEG